MYSWHLPANFLVLRMVSFACDDHWAALAERDAKKLEGTADDSLSTGVVICHAALIAMLCYHDLCDVVLI